MSYRFLGTTVEALERSRAERDSLSLKAARASQRLGAQPAPSRASRLEALPPVPRRPRSWARAAAKAAPAPPSAAVIALTRLAWGPRPGDVAAFDVLGATDTDRLSAWLDIQLDPAAIDDSAAEARLLASGFTTLGKSLEQLWADHVVPDDLPWEERVRPAYEVSLAGLVRAVHSERQLLEVMVGFWHDHFSVYAWDWPQAMIWPHTDRDAIRPHALGSFRQMLGAVARTPSMLFYLDNYLSSADDANENYGRELLELHTLGAEHYLGNIPAASVPLDGQGRPLGYVEQDVVEAARCLTGWTVDLDWLPGWTNTGAFLYWDEWHDHGSKQVLGTAMAPSRPPMADGEQLLDLLAQHPGTGLHVSRKIARRLLGDDPPATLVARAAAVFTAQHAAPDQITQVIREIVLSPEFLTTWADKVKRPIEIVVSALRGAAADLPFVYQEDLTDWFLWQLYQTGHYPFGWHPPDGFPDVKAAWNTTSPRVMSWRLANFLATARDAAEQPVIDVMAQTPPEVRSAMALVDFWTERILGRPAPATEHAELVELMAQGHNPYLDLPLDSDEDTQTRLRALIAVVLMSPSFLWR